jgi:hypothetical protein
LGTFLLEDNALRQFRAMQIGTPPELDGKALADTVRQM